MNTSYLEEYITCTKSMNMRKAASELHISQSNLSKHMKQLEDEVGCSLFSRDDNRLTLTEAGAHFLEGSRKIVAMLDHLRDNCEAVGRLEQERPAPTLTFQQHSYIDESVKCYYELIDAFKQAHPSIRVLFAKSSRRSFIQELQSGSIDLCIVYRYGEIESIKKEFETKHLASRHLATDPLVIWCPVHHKLNREGARIEDLRDTPIMVPADAAAPMARVAKQLCHSCGFEPAFHTSPATNQAEFLTNRVSGAVYLYPRSFTECALFSAHHDMVAVSLGGDVVVHSFALAFKSDKPLTNELAHFIEKDGGGCP